MQRKIANRNISEMESKGWKRVQGAPVEGRPGTDQLFLYEKKEEVKVEEKKVEKKEEVKPKLKENTPGKHKYSRY